MPCYHYFEKKPAMRTKKTPATAAVNHPVCSGTARKIHS